MRQRGHTSRQTPLGWRCSSCREVISKIEEGWVEWLATERSGIGVLLKGLRLVHRSAVPAMSRDAGCRYDFHREFLNDRSIVEGLPLERFVGPDGLMLLLSFLAVGELPKDDVLELTKRVQIQRSAGPSRQCMKDAGADASKINEGRFGRRADANAAHSAISKRVVRERRQ